MRTRLLLAAIILLVFLSSFLARGLLEGPGGDDLGPPGQVRRIVSMAPSVTETLYELGLGDQVVGVTRYCDYPPEVKTKTRIGGLLDPSLEALVALEPDVVVMLRANQKAQPALGQLDLRTLVVSHADIEGVLESIATIGRAFDRDAEARAIESRIRTRMERVAAKTARLPRPRVMLVIERTLGSGSLEDVCITGRGGFLDRMITLAGGRNALEAGAAPFPIISGEGILEINPQVILDAVEATGRTNVDKAAILADWRQVAEVDAVRNRRVYVLKGDVPLIPGPRFILLVEELARLLHPEVDW